MFGVIGTRIQKISSDAKIANFFFFTRQQPFSASVGQAEPDLPLNLYSDRVRLSLTYGGLKTSGVSVIILQWKGGANAIALPVNFSMASPKIA